MVEDANAIRRGFIMTPERTRETHSAALKVLERLAEDQGWDRIDACLALWGLTGEGALLAVPLTSSLAFRPEQSADQMGAVPQIEPSLLPTLTHRTAAGRLAMRHVIEAVPDLAEGHRQLALANSEMVEALGEILEREDAAAASGSASWMGYSKLFSAFRWCGVPFLSEEDAQRVGEVIRANASTIAGIRWTYLPSILRDFDCQRQSSVDL